MSNSRFKRFSAQAGEAITYGDWLANTILDYYEGSEVYYTTNTMVICKIPQFSEYVLKIYNYNTTDVNAYYHLSVSIGDNFNTTNNTLTGEVTILSNVGISSAMNSPTVYTDFLFTDHGMIIQSNSNENTLGSTVFVITTASNGKYYGIGMSNHGAFKNADSSKCVNLENKSICYMNPLGTPSPYLGINNEKYNLELHKVTLVTSTLRPMTDADGLNIVFTNFFATICSEFDGHSIYFYKRGYLTANCQYQGNNQWSKRSFFFFDEVDGALIEADTETEAEIVEIV